MAEKQIGCAVIGYGGMGSWHCKKIKDLKGGYVVGIYDIDPARGKAAQEKGLRAYTSREELLADPEIELVTIATPNDVHKEIAIAAMAAGKNVISEKPVAMDSGELEEMIAASKQYGRIFTVHQNRRWDEDYLTAKYMLDNNTLGTIHHIESRVQGSRGIPGDWRNQKGHGGGMLLDWGIHLLDQALMMTLPRKLVSVYGTLTNVTNENCDDGFYCRMKFDDGMTFDVEVTTNNFISLPRWYVLGQNGSAVIEDWSLKGKIVMVSDWENRDAVPVQAGAGLTKTMAPRTDDTIKKFRLHKVHADWGEYYQNIFAVLRGETQQLITHDQQRRLIRLVEAIVESHNENKVVCFNE